MKIGFVLVGTMPAGLHQVMQSLSFHLKDDHELYTIEASKAGVALNIIQKERVLFSHEFEAPLLKVSSIPDQGQGQMISSLDAVVMFYSENKEHVLKWLDDSMIPYVAVPVLGADETSTSKQLGYDTALDSTITHILKVKDTINSMKYDNPRLFGVQLPTVLPTALIEDIVEAVDEYYLQSLDGSKAIASQLANTFSKGKTYGFLVFSSELEPELVEEHIRTYIEVDWKYVQVDPSLCVGPYPSGEDRLIANKVAKQIIAWCKDPKSNVSL